MPSLQSSIRVSESVRLAPNTYSEASYPNFTEWLLCSHNNSLNNLRNEHNTKVSYSIAFNI